MFRYPSSPWAFSIMSTSSWMEVENSEACGEERPSGEARK
jgi:hypothetical protein